MQQLYTMETYNIKLAVARHQATQIILGSSTTALLQFYSWVQSNNILLLLFTFIAASYYTELKVPLHCLSYPTSNSTLESRLHLTRNNKPQTKS